MKKTPITQLIDELESLKHLTTNPEKKEAFVIAIGLAKAKLDEEEKQIIKVYEDAWSLESAEQYFNRIYNNNQIQ